MLASTGGGGGVPFKPTRCTFLVASGSLALLAVSYFMFSGRSSEMVTNTSATWVTAADSGSMLTLQPVSSTFAGVEVDYIIPPLPKLSDLRALRHVLLLFHGCTHSGKDWFNWPEERILVAAALRKSFVVVSFTSSNRWSGCWEGTFPPSDNTEVASVKEAFDEVIVTIAQEATAAGWRWDSDFVQYVGLGGSSGGNFVALLPSVLPLHGIALYISPGHPDVFKPDVKGSACASSTLQNVVFVYMPKDTEWASAKAVAEAKRKLTSASCGPKTVSTHEVLEKAVTVELMQDRLPLLVKFPECAAGIVKLLSRDLHPDTAVLKVDPRSPAVNVEAIVKEACTAPELRQDLPELTNYVQEVLNMCFAQHEYTSENVYTVLSELIAL